MSLPLWTAERMKRHGPRLATRSLVAWLVLVAFTGGATAHGPDPVLPGSRWLQNEALQYAWRAGAVPPSAYQTAINAAAADVAASRASQAATFSYASGASNPIGYGVGATCSVGGIACFTRNPPAGFTMWMREHGHRFDWGTLRWCQAYTTWPNGCFDVENIMLDEFGHVEILNHHANHADGSDYTDAVVQALSHAKPADGWDAHAFGRCDVGTLQMQYDMQGWGAKYSTCLDLATTLTITANPTGVVPGGSTLLTATLKVADVASYVRLANNPVGLRIVRLQQRVGAATTWTDLGVMTAGSSGTYTKRYSVRSTTQFRALFAAPTDEGLRAATSPIVTVSTGQPFGG